ncbi:alkaline shock response membrane anchor protein AmaP [Streptococcus didelphis]|uniref:Alkaline shock response membrane anchor protein AmaP n=1 Tax=Streptococcus didelphis TaxID=102886 RepID=A0ABY9LH96_9STRE|nr:alkaline shock response membrane anchor protein AmaP [Streptococcus didelphis]WMB28229.1 alkaline shock response membrane anchor protein AmaP [Streptococcus didelphis]WMB28903.1 alkaline shock response membrane anchor protein AmaP [Streptococcus didelphis]
MAKALKIIYSLLGLILLSIFIMVMGVTQPYLDMPSSYHWLAWDLDNVSGFLNPSLYYYFFWVAAAFAVITLVAILVIIFYPRTYTEIQLSKKQGSLLLKKSAIEGYVGTAVKEAGLMTNPNVTAKLYKRKFTIDVAGKLDSRVGVTDQINGIKEGVTTGLNKFFGLDKPVNFKVRVKDIADSDMRFANKDRVE